MNRPVGLASSLVAATACCFAAATTTALAADPAASPPPPPGDYRVEPDHTEVLFGVNHLGFTTYYGIFTGASGRLHLDVSDPATSTVEVSVPVASVLTPSPKLNEELRSAAWLDAGRFPQMTFRSRRIVMTGPGAADIEGDLSLHGATHPLVLHAKFDAAGPSPTNHVITAGFTAHGVLKRSQFGVSNYVPLVGDDVRLTISAAFERTPEAK
ncbi:MAG TPA: YceI family protein [Caulobacteraceae bacterium]|jgi:polyisoprenoid-binding protein YceI|nr:YceI family protein [Caulobacteraceae bacterium]